MPIWRSTKGLIGAILHDIASVDGISAITINGHAAEVHALTIEEQYRAVV